MANYKGSTILVTKVREEIPCCHIQRFQKAFG